MGFIYKITNNFDNNVYIGLTRKNPPIQRMYQHRYLARHLSSRDSSYLHKAMNAHGVENFKFEVIEEVNDDELETREQYWIKEYNSRVPNGYNITEGGEGTVGYARPQSQEERNKKSQSLKRYYQEHPEAKQQISERFKQYFLEHPEAREARDEGLKKYKLEHPDYMRGKNNPFYGKHHTEESLKKIYEASEKRKMLIQQLDKDTLEVINTYKGVKCAERALNVSHGWISKAAKQGKIAYGYRWKIIESVTTNDSSEISTE